MRVKKKGKSIIGKISKTLSGLGKSLSKGTKGRKGSRVKSLFVPKMSNQYKTKKIRPY